jgi:hypothetical protein
VKVGREVIDDRFKTVTFVCGMLIDECKERCSWCCKGDFNEDEFTVDLGDGFGAEEGGGGEGDGCGCGDCFEMGEGKFVGCVDWGFPLQSRFCFTQGRYGCDCAGFGGGF